MNPLPQYPGSKGGSGVAERLVSLMPAHDVYVEPFLGGGAVLRLKRASRLSIGLDLSYRVVSAWEAHSSPGLPLAAAERGHGEGCCFANHDAIDFIRLKPPILRERTTLVYLDPPYLLETRSGLIYDEEMQDPLRHAQLLALIHDLPCMVMISHYPHPLYAAELQSWRRIEYRCMTRGGPRTECCWLNFPEPTIYHDTRFQGDGFRERERIKRKSRRWQSRFQAMPAAERQVVASALASVDRASIEAALQPIGSADIAAGIGAAGDARAKKPARGGRSATS